MIPVSLSIDYDSISHGAGLLFLPDGSIVLSDFHNNKLNGFGIWVDDDDNTFSGYMSEGKPYQVCISTSHEFSYMGTIKESKPHGLGILIRSCTSFGATRSNQYIYLGNFENGTPHGLGILLCRDYIVKVTMQNGVPLERIKVLQKHGNRKICVLSGNITSSCDSDQVKESPTIEELFKFLYTFGISDNEKERGDLLLSEAKDQNQSVFNDLCQDKENEYSQCTSFSPINFRGTVLYPLGYYEYPTSFDFEIVPIEIDELKLETIFKTKYNTSDKYVLHLNSGISIFSDSVDFFKSSQWEDSTSLLNVNDELGKPILSSEFNELRQKYKNRLQRIYLNISDIEMSSGIIKGFLGEHCNDIVNGIFKQFSADEKLKNFIANYNVIDSSIFTHCLRAYESEFCLRFQDISRFLPGITNELEKYITCSPTVYQTLCVINKSQLARCSLTRLLDIFIDKLKLHSDISESNLFENGSIFDFQQLGEFFGKKKLNQDTKKYIQLIASTLYFKNEEKSIEIIENNSRSVDILLNDFSIEDLQKFTSQIRIEIPPPIGEYNSDLVENLNSSASNILSFLIICKGAARSSLYNHDMFYKNSDEYIEAFLKEQNFQNSKITPSNNENSNEITPSNNDNTSNMSFASEDIYTDLVEKESKKIVNKVYMNKSNSITKSKFLKQKNSNLKKCYISKNNKYNIEELNKIEGLKIESDFNLNIENKYIINTTSSEKYLYSDFSTDVKDPLYNANIIDLKKDLNISNSNIMNTTNTDKTIELDQYKNITHRYKYKDTSCFNLDYKSNENIKSLLKKNLQCETLFFAENSSEDVNISEISTNSSKEQYKPLFSIPISDYEPFLDQVIKVLESKKIKEINNDSIETTLTIFQNCQGRFPIKIETNSSTLGQTLSFENSENIQNTESQNNQNHDFLSHDSEFIDIVHDMNRINEKKNNLDLTSDQNIETYNISINDKNLVSENDKNYLQDNITEEKASIFRKSSAYEINQQMLNILLDPESESNRKTAFETNLLKKELTIDTLIDILIEIEKEFSYIRTKQNSFNFVFTELESVLSRDVEQTYTSVKKPWNSAFDLSFMIKPEFIQFLYNTDLAYSISKKLKEYSYNLIYVLSNVKCESRRKDLMHEFITHDHKPWLPLTETGFFAACWNRRTCEYATYLYTLF